ncbi:hypothetical protein [Clostridium botulinum]|uniref:hypothetical protein n=1 Tax=Clostridium botulinum TaxID=1491 RepID=UPI001968567B|nr:hypothetical protein [Clostridium botulinum]
MFNTILLILGLYFCTVVGIITECDNLISKILLKIIPFLGGLYLIFIFFKLQGYITL